MSDMKPRRTPSLFGFNSPGWLCRLRRHVMDTLPKVYGPRGMIMLGKAMLCICFGVAYIGIFQQPKSPGLEMVREIMPLQLWAVAWFLCAFTLITSAFKVDQAKALGGVAGMLSLWSLSYLVYFFRVPVLPDGGPNLSFLFAALLASMALSTVGAARMLNHGETHIEVIEKPGGI